MNRIAIKEHIIHALKDKMGKVPYSITGEYPEKIESIAIIVSIANERPILGRTSGRISFDPITNIEKTLYVYMVTIGFTVYAPVDEEAVTICGNIRDIINTHRFTFIKQSIGIKKVFDVSGISTPTMRESGGRKTWAAQVTMEIQTSEIIESSLSTVG